MTRNLQLRLLNQTIVVVVVVATISNNSCSSSCRHIKQQVADDVAVPCVVGKGEGVNVIHMELCPLHMGCVCHGRGSVSIVGMYSPPCCEGLGMHERMCGSRTNVHNCCRALCLAQIMSHPTFSYLRCGVVVKNLSSPGSVHAHVKMCFL